MGNKRELGWTLTIFAPAVAALIEYSFLRLAPGLVHDFGIRNLEAASNTVGGLLFFGGVLLIVLSYVRKDESK